MPQGFKGFQKGENNPAFGKHPWNFGKHPSKETLKKQSESHIGNSISEEARKKISIANKGKKKPPRSMEHRKKLSLIHKGKKQSKELIEKRISKIRGRKQSDAEKKKRSLTLMGRPNYKLRGKNNPNWKGGVSPLMHQIRSSLKNKEWKIKIFIRDNRICRKTGLKGKIEVHHIKNFAKIIMENNIKTLEDAEKCEELWNIKNGVVLLKEVHAKFHQIYGRVDNNYEQLEKFNGNI